MIKKFVYFLRIFLGKKLKKKRMENFTESEALDAYDEINSFMLQLGDVGQPKAETLEKFLKMLKRVEDSIVRESMFSENEELEDINEEFLK